MKMTVLLKIWELLSPYLAEWIDAWIRRWIGKRGGKV